MPGIQRMGMLFGRSNGSQGYIRIVAPTELASV